MFRQYVIYDIFVEDWCCSDFFINKLIDNITLTLLHLLRDAYAISIMDKLRPGEN